MNRERLLFGGVVAILGLWFVLRAAPTPVDAAQPPVEQVTIREVAGADLPAKRLTLPERSPFDIVTNEEPHPRPALPSPDARDLVNVWPPTSHSVRTVYYGRLRHAAAAPDPELPVLELPALSDEVEAQAGGPQRDRLDEWVSFNQAGKGSVTRLVVNGKTVSPPKDLPPVGRLEGYYRLLGLLQVDPGKAQEEGVNAVVVRLDINGRPGGQVQQSFPADIHDFRIGVEGRQRGWIQGAMRYLTLPDRGFGPHVKAGKSLLEAGRADHDKALLQWAMYIFEEARARIPEADQTKLREVLEMMLEGASLLNDQERVLGLAFDHLSRFAHEDTVLEYVGNMLASRTFGLLEQAEDWYARAAGSRHAQRKRVGVLISLGRFEEAEDLIASGRAGSGADVELLAARIALAKADFDTARNRARALTGGEYAAEANQIIGGAYYAEGKAAEAEAAFLRAVEAEPRRSTAYSDLGLALAVQGKEQAAHACFERAAALDFENAVIPAAGRAYLKLTAAEAKERASAAAREEAETTKAKATAQKKAQEADTLAAESDTLYQEAVADLQALAENNPRDLLIRYYLGFAQEKAGDLEGAAARYRSIIDENHRYRIAIARLGVVQAKRVERSDRRQLVIEAGVTVRRVTEEEDLALVREAVAHLEKSIFLNPDEPVLPYILGRFLLWAGTDAVVADRNLAKVEELPVPAADPNLPLWSRAGRAVLIYRNPLTEEIKVKSAVQRVAELIEDQVERAVPVGQRDTAIASHPVQIYLKRCAELVQENEQKVDVTWSFQSKPRDWDFRGISPMGVSIQRGKGVQFRGTVEYKGGARDHTTVLEHCAVEWPGRDASGKITGIGFYELIVEGEIGDNREAARAVDLGIGIIGTGRGRRKLGRTGIQIKREARNATAEVRLDGGEDSSFKANKARSYIEMTKVAWPSGPFTVRIQIEDRQLGLFRLFLKAGDSPEVNVFETQLGRPNERCRLFGKGAGTRPIAIVVWVEGNDGDEYRDIFIRKITLTKAK